MSLALEPNPTRDPDRLFVLEHVDWDYYDRTLELGEDQRIRVTYDGGRMELMTSTEIHESIRTAVARLIEHYAFVADVAIQGRRNLTCRREDLDKGLEPDECYYVVNRPVRDAKGHLDFVNGPPPDLAIEVEVTRTVIARRPIYQALGVLELWRVDETRVQVMHLVAGQYTIAERSRFFPALDLVRFDEFVRLAVADQHAALKAFDQWIRQTPPSIDAGQSR